MVDVSHSELEPPQTTNKYEWQQPPDSKFNEDPWHCFERTVDHTKMEILSAPEVLSNLVGIYSFPIYYEEWRQGAVQRLLKEMLEQDLREDEAIEVNLVLNELGPSSVEQNEEEVGELLVKYKKRTQQDEDDGQVSQTALNTQIDEAVDNDLQFRSAGTTDYSEFTHEEYIQFRTFRYGKHVPYPQSLHIREEHFSRRLSQLEQEANLPQRDYVQQDIVSVQQHLVKEKEKIAYIEQANQDMLSFFQDLVLVQRLYRQQQEYIKKPEIFWQLNTLYQNVMEKYENQRDLQEILRLAYAGAERVDLSFINTLQMDFLAEGYGSKNLASARCVGADYIVERTKALPKEQQDRVFAILGDVDTLVSPNFSHELHGFYAEHTDIDYATVPLSMLPAPGTTPELFASSLDVSSDWVGVKPGIAISNPQFSQTVPLLREFRGLIGDSASGSSEDRKRSARINRYITHDEERRKKYRERRIFPPIATVMLDRPGIVDGLGRDKGSAVRAQEGSRRMREFLARSNEKNIFERRENITRILIDWDAQIVFQQHLEAEAEKAGEPDVYAYLQERGEQDKLSAYFRSSVDPDKYEGLFHLQTDQEYFQTALDFYHHALAEYTHMLRQESKMNQRVIGDLLRQLRNGNLHFDGETQIVQIIDQSLLPEEISFYEINYVQSNQKFLSSLSGDDIDYVEYLLGQREELPENVRQNQDLSAIQKALREYLGVFRTVTQAKNFVGASGEEQREIDNRSSVLFACYSEKLAYELTFENFVSRLVPDEAEYSHPLQPVMADFDERVKGIREVTSQMR